MLLVFSGGPSAALFMDKIHVGDETQETGTRLPSIPNRGETLVQRADGRAIISSSSTESREAPAMNPHLLSNADMQLFQQGTHCRLQEKLGAHPVTVKGVSGVQFAVWAPNAERVSVMGDFNQWDRKSHPLRALADCGIWAGFVPGAQPWVVLQVFHQSRLRRLPRGEDRPVCIPRRIATEKRIHRSGTSTTLGVTACG